MLRSTRLPSQRFLGTLAGFTLMLLFYALFDSPIAHGQNAAPTVKEIYEKALKRNQLIKSLSFEAVVERTDFSGALGKKAPPVMTSRETFAFLDDKRLSKRAPVPGPGGKPEDSSRTHIFNGKTTFMLDPGFVLISDKKAPQCDQESYCLDFLSLALSEEDKARQQVNLSFPLSLNPVPPFPLWSLPYKVLPTMEAVDGQLCYVVDLAGRDRLWVDPQLGFALRQRIKLESPGTDKTPYKSHHYTLSDYTEAAPGVWVPKKVSLVYFRQEMKAGKLVNQPAIEIRIQVESIKINQIDAQFFNPEVRPKTILVNKVGSIIVGGNKPIRLNDIDTGFKPK
jgi:hypothetical protein